MTYFFGDFNLGNFIHYNFPIYIQSLLNDFNFKQGNSVLNENARLLDWVFVSRKQ